MTRHRIVLALLAVGGAFSLPLAVGSVTASTVVVTAVGALSIGLGVILWIQQGASDVARPAAPSTGSASVDRVGWRVDEALRASPAESQVSPFRTKRILRQTLDTVLVERGGLSPAEAVERRRAGAWTDDPRAATLLGDSDVRPLSLRLRDWLVGDEFATNLRATVAEIDRLATELDGPRRTGPAGDGVRDGPGVGTPGTDGSAGAAGSNAGTERPSREVLRTEDSVPESEVGR